MEQPGCWPLETAHGHGEHRAYLWHGYLGHVWTLYQSTIPNQLDTNPATHCIPHHYFQQYRHPPRPPSSEELGSHLVMYSSALLFVGRSRPLDWQLLKCGICYLGAMAASVNLSGSRSAVIPRLLIRE